MKVFASRLEKPNEGDDGSTFISSNKPGIKNQFVTLDGLITGFRCGPAKVTFLILFYSSATQQINYTSPLNEKQDPIQYKMFSRIIFYYKLLFLMLCFETNIL